MKILIKTFLLNIIIITLISCNTKENNIQKEDEIRSEMNAGKLKNLKEKYIAKELFEDTEDYYYSFELENNVVNKNVVGLGNILDIEKINDDLFILKLFLHNEPYTKYFCELKATKIQVDRILKARNQKIIELEKKYDNKIVISTYLKILEFAFVFEPHLIKKGLYINTSVEDYYITGENIEEAKLEDYVINIEVDSDYFTIVGKCIDFQLINH